MTTSYGGSLCWDCKRAGGGLGCCFVDNKPSGSTPVPGWTAERKTISASSLNKYGLRSYELYIVKDCPLFEEG